MVGTAKLEIAAYASAVFSPKWPTDCVSGPRLYLETAIVSDCLAVQALLAFNLL